MNVQNIISHWKLLQPENTSQLKAAIAQLHRGVQFIAMFGKHYLPHQADDSHTNMEWVDELQMMVGDFCPTDKGEIRWAMHLSDFQLILLDAKDQKLADCKLHGKTKEEVLQWFKAQLAHLGLNSEHMQMDLHYDIPEHETDKGLPFNHFDAGLFERVADHYANADRILRHYETNFPKNASSVRVWPHHFDIGTYVPMAFDKEGNAQSSFSLGYAIPDGVVDDFYFYITQWKNEETLDYSKIGSLPYGQWLPEQLHGAALTASDIAKNKSEAEQVKCVTDYVQAGIDTSLQLIGASK